MSFRKIKLIIMATSCLVIVTACSSSNIEPIPSSQVSEQESSTTVKPTTSVESTSAPIVEGDYTVVGSGLRIPWSIEFDSNTIYVSEREGTILKIENNELNRQAVRLTKPVHHDGEGGFLGFILAPDFHETGLAFAYHTYQNNGSTLNRVVMLKIEGAEWAEHRILLENIPGDLYHNGGRIAIGPDGHLYVTTGDAEQKNLSLDKSSLAGKILRMKLDGSIPDDNPLPDSYVYSYGHRNPQGLAWTKDGTLYSSEHGPSGRPGGHDEINVIDSGKNYGWPDIIGDAKKEGMITPIYHTGDEAIAPSGTIIDDKGRLIIAALRGEAIYRYTPESGVMEVLHKGEGRIRDLELRDGMLYFITNNRDGRGQPSNIDDRLVAMKYK
ncbi:sorbosone dehydrogenase family protein [Paenibacillus sp. L3-i20]|uniref:PQQ-dependent sugar dehydrogenase n=1 Tax=Paenibacillus sp. L3-i20 TaxID=2905833 RepID=UPI001EDE603A|nr:PQQ-dependent sugar dehydrogenase [Paenibacillus sp. L3-i20]GKU80582.1 dehydrogenase [Paenibacillus sp. L3-i20]